MTFRAWAMEIRTIKETDDCFDEGNQFDIRHKNRSFDVDDNLLIESSPRMNFFVESRRYWNFMPLCLGGRQPDT